MRPKFDIDELYTPESARGKPESEWTKWEKFQAYFSLIVGATLGFVCLIACMCGRADIVAKLFLWTILGTFGIPIIMTLVFAIFRIM